MKVAIVNQPLDVIVPPYQNSVGYYTWGIARPLSHLCDVTVYGMKDPSRSEAQESDGRPLLHYVPSAMVDRILYSVRTRLGSLFQFRNPVSTSSLLFPHYGRDVARDIRERHFDIVHIQQCSQYAPLIRCTRHG